MRFFLSLLLTMVLAFLAGLYLPWWSIAPAAFLPPLLLRLRPGTGFLSGFAAIFILWGSLSLWINAANESLLAEKVARILPLGGSAALLILVTALVGALVGGTAGLAGGSFVSKRPGY